MSSIQSAGELFKQYLEPLSKLYENEEAKSILFWLLEDYYQLRKSDVLINKRLESLDLKKLDQAMNRLLAFEPIQHILGYAWFLGGKYLVDRNVLIPRQETEELVSLIAKENSTSKPVILDIGTGSGVIAISLKKQIPDAVVIGWDISTEALDVAKKNAIMHNVKISFQSKDILANQFTNETYDVIVSNPPYILEEEKPEMSQNVLVYDPPMALFVSNDDPLLFYRQITEFAKLNLNSNGRLYFEINERFGHEVCQNLNQNGFKDVRIIKDLNEKDRIVTGVLK